MMKSIGFFLAVFAAGLLGLCLVSGDLRRWLTGDQVEKGMEALPEPKKASPEEARPETDAAGSELNEIKVPVYDVVKGRLEYTFRGHLNEEELSKLQDIQDLESLSLRDGRLEVPIYDDVARDLPAVEEQKKARLFVLTFARGEYKASFRSASQPGISAKERVRETVRLLGGGDRGLGKLDDGTTFRFEELVFEIDRKPGSENFFTIHSSKPVSIQNGYLRLESPAGLDGIVSKEKGLQKLTFFPPVRTYLDPAAARLFGLGGGEISPGSSPPPGAGAPPIPKNSPGAPPAAIATGAKGAATPAETPGKEVPRAAPAKVAITCDGPLTFFLDLEPPSIRFDKDVLIYPLEGPEPERGAPPPPPGSTWFHCQLLVIEVDSKASPPLPSRAVATWEGGRIQAHHQGKLMEGDRLVWSLPRRPPPVKEGSEGGAQVEKDVKKAQPGKGPRGEAVLTGSPRITGDEGRLETGEILFELDEDRILLQKGLKGVFRTVLAKAGGARSSKTRDPKKKDAAPEGSPGRKAETAAPSESKEAGFEPVEKLPDSWEISADEGEIVFAPRGAEGAGSPARRGASPIGPRTLERLVARAKKDEGLVIKSQGDGRFRLAGRVLTYDAPAHTVTIEGGEGEGPRFQHDRVQGGSRSIQLRTEEGLVTLRGGVAVKIEGAEGLGVPAAAPGGEEGLAAPVELLAEELDLRFDSSQKLLGAEARGKTGETGPAAPVVLQSLSPRSGFRLFGSRMSWDQVDQVATVQGSPGQASPSPPADGAGCQAPELDFDGGRLIADGLRFDRRAWRVSLLGHVLIDQCASLALAPDPERTQTARRGESDDGFELSAGRAEVDLNETLRVNEKVDCGSAKELRKVRKIHAWADEAEAIEIRSQRFHGRSQEAAWDSDSQELHIFGPGRQELVLYDAGKESTLTSKDIVYQCAARKVILTGEVQGEVRVEAHQGKMPAGETDGSPTPGTASAEEASLSKASSGGAGGEVLTFHFETNRVEVVVQETEKGLEPVTVRALEKVLLRNELYGISLDGDDLFYDHEKRELRIFSEAGRYQKLSCSHGTAETAGSKVRGEPSAAKVDQIESREIRLSYHLAPAAPGRNSSPILEYMVVKFKDDVTATFFASMKTEVLPGAEGGGPREEWKMQSDYLGIKLVPNEDRLRAVQLALAEGNVIFRSGDYMAIAQEAIYEESLRNGESLKKLRLRGDGQKPARLFNNAKTPPVARAKSELVIYKRGESSMGWEEQTEKPQREPAGLEELRREPQAR